MLIQKIANPAGGGRIANPNYNANKEGTQTI